MFKGGTGFSPAVQRAGQGDVVDVMAGQGGIRPGLPPTCHACVDEARIILQQDIGTEAEPFHDTGPEALDQAIGGSRQLADECYAIRMFEVDADRAARSIDEVAAYIRHDRTVDSTRGRPIDADDLRTVIGEHHAAEGRRTEPREFENAQSGQRTRAMGGMGHRTGS